MHAQKSFFKMPMLFSHCLNGPGMMRDQASTHGDQDISRYWFVAVATPPRQLMPGALV